ncbi:MAG: carbon starvation protein A, partial [Nitrospinae bacterium]|nr:carbon starvation protein A [Nitrospinota bacterium]
GQEGVLGLPPLMFWFVALLIYTYFAAVLPVNILLQPRDYLSAFVLFGSMALGLAALFWVHPTLNTPAFLGGFSQEQGPVWPMLFVLVACGAVSGFHSLVVGGTVSKQLASESHGRIIAYGGMLTEGVIAVMTVLLVGGGLYWAAPAVGNIDMATLGFRESLKAGGWIYAYGNGFGSVVSQMWPWLGFTFASMIAVLALNTFVLTTMDASVRITRFIFEEFLGRKVPILYNKYVSTGIITFLVYLVGASEGWQKIWPVFGAANQLIAAMALMVISAYLVGVKKPSHFTLYPAIFMVVTTVAALAWQAYAFLSAPSPNLFLGGTSVVLIALALFVGNEGWQALRGRRVARLEPVPSEI